MELRAGTLARLGPPAATLAAVLALCSPAAAADLERPASDTRVPAGYRLTAEQAKHIAERTPEARRELARHADLRPTAYLKRPGKWQVSFFSVRRELVQVQVDDANGAVLEAWTGPQVAWRMARGYEGAFGRKFNAPYVWLPLGLLFLIPFVNVRRPFRILHLDLLVLLAFGVSHVFFNRGEISTSVPLAYPVLAYLVARMLWLGFRPGERDGPLIPHIPIAWLWAGLLFLIGFRIGLNVVDSNVIDVGYSGVIGADRIADGESLYEGSFAKDNQHGDTYGPFAYLAYLPFEQALPWSGAWDDLPAAHAAAVTFDLTTMMGLFLLGRRLRPGGDGRTLGLGLAFAWASYPYTLFALSCNTNDSLVAMLIVLALLAATSAPLRGLALGLAASVKFAPLVLVPLMAAGARLRPRAALAFAAVFAVVLAALTLPFLPEGGLREFYDRTLGYQAGRDSPFSIWGQEPSLDWLHTVVKAGVMALALALAFLPRERDVVQLAALGAALIAASQLAATHWFYLYIVWFAPLALVAMLGRLPARGKNPPAVPA